MLLRIAAIIALVTVFGSKFSKADIMLDFGSTGSSQNLPYSEDGFTFTSLLGNSRINVVFIPTTDRYLNLVGNAVGSNVTVRLSSTAPFDLNSVDVEGFSVVRAWSFVGSNGSTLDLANGALAGSLDFTSLTGWKNLNYVDIIHDDAEANANLRLDNFNVSLSIVPEPASVLVLGATLATVVCRRRRLC